MSFGKNLLLGTALLSLCGCFSSGLPTGPLAERVEVVDAEQLRESRLDCEVLGEIEAVRRGSGADREACQERLRRKARRMHGRVLVPTEETVEGRGHGGGEVARISCRAQVLGFCALRRSGPGSPPPSQACRLADFSPADSEHIVEFLSEPVVARLPQGRLSSAEGAWPPGHASAIELVPRGAKPAVDRVKVRVGDDGRFSLVELVAPDAVETVFCFKASSDGWQSVVGELVLSRLAAPGSTIELVLEPGV